MLIQPECPHCKAPNSVPDHTIGRYVDCGECHCRFYVPVPPLGSELSTTAVIRGRHRPKRPKTDRPVSANGQKLSRQEELLTLIQAELAAARRQLLACWLATLAAVIVLGLLIWWRT